MKDDKKEVMGTEEPFEEQELIHTQDFESPEDFTDDATVEHIRQGLVY